MHLDFDTGTDAIIIASYQVNNNMFSLSICCNNHNTILYIRLTKLEAICAYLKYYLPLIGVSRLPAT